MYEVFTKLLNMSLLASVLVLAVVLFRIVLKKAPKKIICALWILVAFRLICPISFSSSLSVFNVLNFGSGAGSRVEYFQYNEKTEKPALSFDLPGLVNDDLSTDSMTIGTRTAGVYLPTVMYVWMAGVIIMLSYALISYMKVRREVSASIKRTGNVFVCDEIKGPFILGVLRPRIYIPSGLNKSVEANVLAHENAHIKRLDFLWKPLGFLLLSVYWFNPVMWVAYILFCRDIEAACDEKVIEVLDKEGKAYYSEALLACASGRKMITVCPLAFGETDVKGRVKNVLNYKKPAFWIVLVAVISCAVVAICFMTNPEENTYSIKIVIPANSQGQFYYSEEEISPIKKTITVYSEEGVDDTEVVLKTVDVHEENVYEPTYMTHAMPVEMEAEKGGWFKIGIWAENSADEDRELFLTVKNITVRIADGVEATQTHVIQATVTEIGNGSILVTPVEGSAELSSSDSFSVPIKSMEASSEPKIGDVLEIAYSGGILETYPAMLEGIVWIRVVEQAEQEVQSDEVIKAIMVNGDLYFYTGAESTVTGRCGNMDGNIDSACDANELPTKNNQGNFGTGYGFQYGPIEGTIEIKMEDENWYVFATEKVLASSEMHVSNENGTISEQELVENLSNIVSSIGLENAYPWNNTAEFKEDADVLIKLAEDDSGRYEIYGIISQKYGDFGFLLNDRIGGEDNWNFEYLPWFYSGAPSDQPILEPDGNGKYIFSYVYKYDDGVPMRKEVTLDCGYDTGHMELTNAH